MASFTIDGIETTNQSLSDGEFGIILSTGILAPFGGTAIDASGSYNITIAGSVYTALSNSGISSDDTTVALISLSQTGSINSNVGMGFIVSDSIAISNAGSIIGQDFGISTISLFDDADGHVFSLTNSGAISATRTNAIQAGVGTGFATIINSGTITLTGLSPSAVAAIEINGEEGGFLSRIVNTGTISASGGQIVNTAILTDGVALSLNNDGRIVGDIKITDGILYLTNSGTIQGNIAADAGADNVTLSAGTVTGTINTSLGNDVINLIGGAVSGLVTGGQGSDTYYVDSTTDRIIEDLTLFGTDEDRVISTISWSLGAGFEVLELTGQAIAGTGNFGDNLLYGNDADNILRGRGGRDLLDGGEGEDTLYGGIGNDVYQVDDLDTVIEFAGQGIDTVNVGEREGLGTYTLPANVENLFFAAQTGITAIGNALNNEITAGSFNDTLDGTTGFDTLIGGTGNDVYITDGFDLLIDDGGIDTVQSSISFELATGFENLTLTGTAVTGVGNAAANRIIGNAGANSLNGGLGNDTLTGGAGGDDFVFTAAPGAANIDRITDFRTGVDSIRLENAVFTGLAAGTLAVTAFVQNTSGNAADASDRIIYETDTGALWFDRDGTGGAAKVQFATLNPGLTLSASDFFVI
jgi:Ca2+-binding RTX toxin-like protein